MEAILRDTAVNWKRSTKKCLATATLEAEYVAYFYTSKEVLFKRAVPAFLQPEQTGLRVDVFGVVENAKIAYLGVSILLKGMEA